MAEKTEGVAPGTLLEAILAVQGEVGTLRKDAENPAFKTGGKVSKYLPLDTIVEEVGPVLNKHGLVWMTFPGTNEHGQPALDYALIHAATKEERGGTMPLMVQKADPQGLGSAITYARRYSICAVLNLVADDDDDGNAGAKAAGEQNRALANAKANMSPEANALLDRAQTLREAAQIPDAKWRGWLDSTGYTAEGLQRLVDYLTEQAATKDA